MSWMIKSVQVLFSFQQSDEISSEKNQPGGQSRFPERFLPAAEARQHNDVSCSMANAQQDNPVPVHALSYHAFDHLFSSLLLAHLKKSSCALGMLSALHSSGTGTALTHVAQMLDS